jgi:hypothetical protein
MTYHGSDRATERIVGTLGFERARSIVDAAETYATTAPAGCDIALRVYRDVRNAWAGESNGDTVVAIIRKRRVVTYMLRRSSQAFTPEALAVNRVHDLTGE